MTGHDCLYFEMYYSHSKIVAVLNIILSKTSQHIHVNQGGPMISSIIIELLHGILPTEEILARIITKL